MTELKQMDIIDLPWNNKPHEDQSEDKDLNTSAYDIPDPNKISGIQEREPSPVNDNPLSNMDEEMSDHYLSSADEEDTHRSTRKDTGQLEGPMAKILRTNNHFLWSKQKGDN